MVIIEISDNRYASIAGRANVMEEMGGECTYPIRITTGQYFPDQQDIGWMSGIQLPVLYMDQAHVVLLIFQPRYR